MVVVMAPGACQDQVDAVVARIESAGGQAFVSRGVLRTIIGVVGDTEGCHALNLPVMPGVSAVLRVTAPYKLVSSQAHAERSVVHLGTPGCMVPIGPGTFTLIAGPSAVESPEQALGAARLAAAAGATVMQGGTFTSNMFPLAFQGMGKDGLKILADVREATGLRIVTEVVAPSDVPLVASYVDMLQVGAANMQNFTLLDAVSRSERPILLTRGMQATIDEWLMAAEFIAQRGNLDIVLCEQGIRTFETATTMTLDIGAVPLVQQLSHLPVIVDPSHASGRRDLVVPLARAAMAVGADGLIVDVHPDPENALVDGHQALAGNELRELASSVRQFPRLVGRSPAQPLAG